MTNRRKLLKQQKLRTWQKDWLNARYRDVWDEFDDRTPADSESIDRSIAADMEWTSPYEDLHQDRHDRRVFGHGLLDCPGKGCTIDKILAAVAWNQPPALWTGGGHEYHRRLNNRRKRR
jgi:hypothetical protein